VIELRFYILMDAISGRLSDILAIGVDGKVWLRGVMILHGASGVFEGGAMEAITPSENF
jgi:hypothetical protein